MCVRILVTLEHGVCGKTRVILGGPHQPSKDAHQVLVELLPHTNEWVLCVSVATLAQNFASVNVLLQSGIETRQDPLTRHICVVQFVHKRAPHNQCAWLKNCIVIFAAQQCCHPVCHMSQPWLFSHALSSMSTSSSSLPVLPHNDNTQYIPHISKLPRLTSCAIKNHSGMKTCRVAETRAQQFPQVMSPKNVRPSRGSKLILEIHINYMMYRENLEKKITELLSPKKRRNLARSGRLACRILNCQRRPTSNRRCVCVLSRRHSRYCPRRCNPATGSARTFHGMVLHSLEARSTSTLNVARHPSHFSRPPLAQAFSHVRAEVAFQSTASVVPHPETLFPSLQY